MGYVLLVLGIVIAAAGIILISRNKTVAPSLADNNQDTVVAIEDTPGLKPERMSSEEMGKQFEDFVVRMLRANTKMALTNRNSDRFVDGQLDEASLGPDLTAELRLDKDTYPFAIECKYRSRPQNNLVKWSYPEQLERYRKYSANNKIEVFVAIGVGGEPSAPESVFIVPLNEMKSHQVTVGFLNKYRHTPGSYLYYDIKDHTLR